MPLLARLRILSIYVANVTLVVVNDLFADALRGEQLSLRLFAWFTGVAVLGF